nr:hypothetical protein [Arthrobacter sp. VKM Ac-2550]
MFSSDFTGLRQVDELLAPLGKFLQVKAVGIMDDRDKEKFT